MPGPHDLATTVVPIAELHTYLHNPRQGNVAAIASSLRVNGQYRPLVVNLGTHTGRRMEVLAGNHTLMAARQLDWAEIAVVTVDVDEDQARRIVAADNRTADLGDYDDRLLAELLSSLPDLEGTGYAADDLESLLRNLEEEQEINSALVEEEAWPVIRLQVAPHTYKRFQSVHGQDDMDKFLTLLEYVDG